MRRRRRKEGGEETNCKKQNISEGNSLEGKVHRYLMKKIIETGTPAESGLAQRGKEGDKQKCHSFNTS